MQACGYIIEHRCVCVCVCVNNIWVHGAKVKPIDLFFSYLKKTRKGVGMGTSDIAN